MALTSVQYLNTNSGHPTPKNKCNSYTNITSSSLILQNFLDKHCNPWQWHSVHTWGLHWLELSPMASFAQILALNSQILSLDLHQGNRFQPQGIIPGLWTLQDGVIKLLPWNSSPKPRDSFWPPKHIKNHLILVPKSFTITLFLSPFPSQALMSHPI